MYTVPSKKMLPLIILEILRRQTDSEHRLTQRQITEILESEYQIKADRKTVKRNLMNLIEYGFEIEYSETERTNPDGETETIMSDWFIRHDFEDSEIRLLVDSLLFSFQIPSRQRQELISKLEGLSSRHFESKVKHIQALPDISATNQQLFYTISVLDEAIEKKTKVGFHYGQFNNKGKLEPRRGYAGEEQRHVVDPYQLVATNGRYYLICCKSNFDDLSYYRVDRILDIALTEQPARPLRSIPGYENGLDLPRHMSERLYMFSGSIVRASFIAKRWALVHIFDWFGQDADVVDVDDDHVKVRVRVSEQAMLYWALQFSEYVEVLEPATLRDSLRTAGEAISEKYR